MLLSVLTADTIPKGAPFTSMQEFSLGIGFGKLCQITCVPQLIESCPNSSILQIWVSSGKLCGHDMSMISLIFSLLIYTVHSIVPHWMLVTTAST